MRPPQSHCRHGEKLAPLASDSGPTANTPGAFIVIGWAPGRTPQPTAARQSWISSCIRPKADALSRWAGRPPQYEKGRDQPGPYVTGETDAGPALR
jgi:hypothetical protein